MNRGPRYRRRSGPQPAGVEATTSSESFPNRRPSSTPHETMWPGGTARSAALWDTELPGMQPSSSSQSTEWNKSADAPFAPGASHRDVAKAMVEAPLTAAGIGPYPLAGHSRHQKPVGDRMISRRELIGLS